ncbi:MAG: hypothetical protein PUF79_05765 [Lactobacillaceae bacterium]|nr:hypothetical protein [Lactobacillaceae bacterium]
MFSVIIVDYNSINKTIEYIKDLQLHCNHEKLDFIIVENGDEEIAKKKIGFPYKKKIIINNYKALYYESHCLKFTITFPNDNLGYAKGNNFGFYIEKKLFNNRYLLISNNDLAFNKSLDLRHVTEIFESNKEIGIIGPEIVGTDGIRQSPYVIEKPADRLIFYYWKSVLNFKNINDVDFTLRKGYCDYVSGSFVFIRAEAFNVIGGYDPRTFLYGEEIILSARMKEKKYMTYFTSELRIIHNHSQIVRSNLKTLSILKYGFQSSKYYYRKYNKVSKTLITIANINFLVFQFLYRVKHGIKGN